jgi:hypothetical protein
VARTLQPFPDLIANNTPVTLQSAAISWELQAMAKRAQIVLANSFELVVSVALCGYMALTG